MQLENKGVLVTGGASGLGAACVRLLTQAGAKAVIADLNSETGNSLAKELGDTALFVQTNVTDEESVQAAVQTAVEKLGNLSDAINCAGIGTAENVLGKNGATSRELARYCIRVMTISPVIFDTPILVGLPAPARISLGQQVPFPPRLGRPSEYAALAKHIIENAMLNGEVIRLDGAIRLPKDV